MDARATKTIIMFLQGPCKNAAIVVTSEDSDAVIIDGDSPASKTLLAVYSQEKKFKPVIVLSIQDVAQAGVLHVKKPVKTVDMLLVLDQAKTMLKELSKKTALYLSPALENAEKNLPKLFDSEGFNFPSTPAHLTPAPQPAGMESGLQVDVSEHRELKTFVTDQDERNKKSKHQTAMRLNETSFHDYIGLVEEIDDNDPKQSINAYYQPQNYFQGYLQSAFAACQTTNQILMLQSAWWPITLFPRTQEVWLDAVDLELREFAGIQLNHKAVTTEMALVVVERETSNIGGSLDKFQSMEGFLWKLACWASKGRYPQDIDYGQPVYLKHWPNFTRLLITPHALRIAALLIQGPRCMANLAKALDIKHQYVYVFISAAYAIGLVGQDRNVSHTQIQPQDIKPSKNKGLLGRIMSKLRGN